MMKRCAAHLIFLLLAACVSAQAGERIELFSDEALTDHTLIDTTPRIVDVYVAHLDVTYGSTGCNFSIVASPGFTGVWLGDTSSWFPFGDSQSGIALAYARCFIGSTIMLKVTYQLFGTSTCSSLRTARYKNWLPDSPACDRCFSEYSLPSNSLTINCTVPTEATTWGKVKSLYRD
jgi:hypothetical protein